MPRSRGRLFIKQTSDYHELVGGDFYFYFPIEVYLIVDWNDPDEKPVRVCDTLGEAKDTLLNLLKADHAEPSRG